ncbi:MAG: S8 family serine peptidase [Bacteroidetes bacterium]|nr:S8 family serine peptidase [Bacteroidota bacterium]
MSVFLQRLSILSLLSLLLTTTAIAQDNKGFWVNKAANQQLLEEARLFKEQQQRVSDSFRLANGWIDSVRILPDSSSMSFMFIDQQGRPVFYETHNRISRQTISVDEIIAGGSLGINLDGSGFKYGEWDAGNVLATHREFGNRASNQNSSGTHYHAQHVAGTIMASGVDSNALGMAPAATLAMYDWFSDVSEMVQFASDTGIISNHSYGNVCGWKHNGQYWVWYGDTTISATEDFKFGYYNYWTNYWDRIANANPYYLIVKSAGNDRNEGPTGAVKHLVWKFSGNDTSYTQRSIDGNNGYDCIAVKGNAKNILTVGAVNDIAGGYTKPSDVSISSFSGWGPTDDGRIKPDLVANGVSLYSTGNLNDSQYIVLSGTSMSAPSATGALGLIQDYYFDSTGNYMRSATLKSLAIHTADEAGTADGPDYIYGWGLLNAKSCIEFLKDTVYNHLYEDSLANGDSTVYTFYADSTKLIYATIAWNDPAGSYRLVDTLDPTDLKLVNDLDIYLLDSIGNKFNPWILNPANPSSNAIKGDNIRDNVERINVSGLKKGNYRLVVKHKGSLTGGGQAFSLVVSGMVKSGNTSQTPIVARVEADSLQFEYIYQIGNINGISRNSVEELNSIIIPSDTQWVLPINGGSYEYAVDIANDSKGNTYVFGHFRNNLVYKGVTYSSNGAYDLFVIKFLDTAVVWVKTFGSSNNDYAQSIAIDQDDHVLLTCSPQGTINFGNGSLSGKGSTDIAVVRIRPNGVTDWSKLYGSSLYDEGLGICSDNASNVYVTGGFSSTVTFGSYSLSSSGSEDIFVLKLDSNGNEKWAVKGGSTGGDVGYGLAYYSNWLYLVGNFQNTISFSSLSLSSNGSTDIVVARFNPGFGAVNWIEKAGSTSHDQCGDIAVNSSGIYISGAFQGTATFNSKSLSSNGNYDCFLAKYSFGGVAQTVESFGGTNDDKSYDIALDGNGNVYATGYIVGTNNAKIGSTNIPNKSSRQIFVTKHNASLVNQNAIFANSPGWDQGNAIVINSTGDILNAGYYVGTTDFNGLTITAGSYDGYLWKIPKF